MRGRVPYVCRRGGARTETKGKKLQVGEGVSVSLGMSDELRTRHPNPDT